jgi:hypothetical protein
LLKGFQVLLLAIFFVSIERKAPDIASVGLESPVRCWVSCGEEYLDLEKEGTFSGFQARNLSEKNSVR